jgi:hypothetical protein
VRPGEYGDQRPNYATELKFGVAIWEHEEATVYAYSLGERNEGLPDPVPFEHGWKFVCVLPAGYKISGATPDRDRSYRIKLGGRMVVTSASVAIR